METNELEEIPGCTLSTVKTDFGYQGYVVRNGSGSATYEEDAEYPKFDGVEFLPPHKGNKYLLTAEPGQTSIVIMRMNLKSYQLSKSYSYKVLKNDNALFDECLAEGEVEFRGENIAQYIL